MTLFSIKTTSEKQIIGTQYPQIQTMDGTVNKNAPNSLYNVSADTLPDFIPNLNYFVLQKSAIATDVLSAAMISYGFIVNEKVKDVLRIHRLPTHQFYPAVVKHNQTFLKNYYWFFFISDVLDFIDYDKTRFFITDMVDNKIEECRNINSAQQLRSLKEVLPDDRNVDSGCIFFEKSLTASFDLFKVSFGNYRTYISERLSSALKNISGFTISLSNKVILNE